MIVAYLITILAPLGLLYILHALDSFGLQSRRTVLLALGWGLVSFLLALVIQAVLVGVLRLAFVALILAPLVETALLSAFLYIAMQRGLLVNTIDGLLFGFEIGLSFGLVENLYYLYGFQGEGAAAVGFAATRVLSSGLMHAVTVALIGAAAGQSLRYSYHRQRAYFFAALTAAALMHAAYNIVVFSLQGAWLVVVAVAVGVTGLLAIVLLVRREVRSVNELIRTVGAYQLILGETGLPTTPEALHMAAIRYRYELGDSMVARLEQYARLMAQRLVLQAAIDSLAERQHHRPALEARLSQLSGEIARLTSDLGLFVRMWMSTVIAKDEDLLAAMSTTDLALGDDPQLQMALQVAGRAAALSPDELVLRRKLLAASDLFHGLPPADLEDVAVMLEARRCAAGEVLFGQGQPNDRLFIVGSGQLALRSVTSGEAGPSLGWLKPGDAVGLSSQWSNRPARYTVVCVEAALVYQIDLDALVALLYANPRLAMALLHYQSSRLQRWRELAPDRGPLGALT